MAVVNQTLASPGFGPAGFHPQASGPEGRRAPLALIAFLVTNQEWRNEAVRGRNDGALWLRCSCRHINLCALYMSQEHFLEGAASELMQSLLRELLDDLHAL